MTVHRGDCVEVMAGMEPDSVDAIVTDPPYGLEFMGKEWDRISKDPDIGKSLESGFAEANGRRDTRAGNEGGTWFGSRDAKVPNYSRTTNAKCRTCGKWRFSGGHGGTGNIYGCRCERPDFPNVGADAGHRMYDWHHAWAAAALRVARPGAYMLAFGGTRTVHRMTCALEDAGWVIRDMLVWAYAQGFPKSRASLKPAWEPIVMARKPGPLRDLNIDAARIGTDTTTTIRSGGSGAHGVYGSDDRVFTRENPVGRWPANVILTDPILDGGWDGVVGGGISTTNSTGTHGSAEYDSDKLTGWKSNSTEPRPGSTGTYSRFFLIPKAPTRERVLSDGRRSPHPTQKPEALIRHLVKLVTPDGGLVLDPFLGSGTLGVVCEGLGVRWVGIERDATYADWAEERIADGQPAWARPA